MPIDWALPVEAVHTSGRVVPAALRLPVVFPDVRPVDVGGIGEFTFNQDGVSKYGNGWRIRNVAQAPQTGSTAPSPSEVGPEVTERMIALVRAIVGGAANNGDANHLTTAAELAALAEARAIVALLPEPVDADLVDAKAFTQEHGWNAADADKPMVRFALAAIKRGRALEKEAGR